MKKFIFIAIAIMFIGFAAAYLYYDRGVRILPSTVEIESIEPAFVQEGKTIYHRMDGQLEEFEIKGVDIGSTQPGNFSTDFAISKETYLRWFRQIKDLGANCVRTYVLSGPAFYDAFHEFNEGNPDPLYLLQGVWVQEYVTYSHLSAFDSDFKDVFKDDVKTMIDAIHGQKPMELGTVSGTGSYSWDVSPWTMGYILGSTWESGGVVYTNLIDDERTSYTGDYLRTTEGATPFEVMLAEVGDDALRYETERYGEQRLVAFSNTAQTDPFEYPELIARKFQKVTEVDAEHIAATDAVKSGLFLSYSVNPSYPDLYRFVDYEGKADGSGGNTYVAYLRDLVNYHSWPVVVSEFGIPTSRGRSANESGASRHQGLMTEQEQGVALVECYRDIREADCAGCLVYMWQDEWWRHSSNTWPLNDTLHAPDWNNVQTPEQGFGLLTFDPGEEGAPSHVDGDDGEWASESVVGSNEVLELSVTYDVEYLHLLIEGDGVGPDEALYVPIDTTQKSGSTWVGGTDLAFDRAADFLLVLDGEENSHLLVQERYESLRATSWTRISRDDPYTDPPAVNSAVFKPIYRIIEDNPLRLKADISIDALLSLDAQRASRLIDKYSQVYETGKLIYGNSNPDSDDYNSVADFHYGEGFVEVRLPWELLNFSDPSLMQIHDDYYEHYGVENMAIDALWIGVGRGAETIPLFEVPLRPWGDDVTYHERLRESYYLLQSVWSGGVSPEELIASTMADGTGDAPLAVEVLSYDDIYHNATFGPTQKSPTDLILEEAAR